MLTTTHSVHLMRLLRTVLTRETNKCDPLTQINVLMGISTSYFFFSSPSLSLFCVYTPQPDLSLHFVLEHAAGLLVLLGRVIGVSVQSPVTNERGAVRGNHICQPFLANKERSEADHRCAPLRPLGTAPGRCWRETPSCPVAQKSYCQRQPPFNSSYHSGSDSYGDRNVQPLQRPHHPQQRAAAALGVREHAAGGSVQGRAHPAPERLQLVTGRWTSAQPRAPVDNGAVSR